MQGTKVALPTYGFERFLHESITGALAGAQTPVTTPEADNIAHVVVNLFTGWLYENGIGPDNFSTLEKGQTATVSDTN